MAKKEKMINVCLSTGYLVEAIAGGCVGYGTEAILFKFSLLFYPSLFPFRGREIYSVVYSIDKHCSNSSFDGKQLHAISW